MAGGLEPSDDAPTQRFSDRAGDYARYRPSYPAAALDAILDGLGSPASLHAADVGAGTGIFARLLADRGVQVVAVEPNAAMRSEAAPHSRVLWRDGTAEATGLGARSQDLVTVAQAFHWFRVPETLREFQRVLRSGGRLAILWNRRSREDAFAIGYRQALEAIDGEAPAERIAFDPAAISGSGWFVGERRVEFRMEQPMTEAELLGRAMSTSTVPKSGPKVERLLGLLRELHARHRGADGCATMVYRTEVHLWERA
jgi:SAM-dependent methyltransferase